MGKKKYKKYKKKFKHEVDDIFDSVEDLVDDIADDLEDVAEVFEDFAGVLGDVVEEAGEFVEDIFNEFTSRKDVVTDDAKDLAGYHHKTAKNTKSDKYAKKSVVTDNMSENHENQAIECEERKVNDAINIKVDTKAVSKEIKSNVFLCVGTVLSALVGVFILWMLTFLVMGVYIGTDEWLFCQFTPTAVYASLVIYIIFSAICFYLGYDLISNKIKKEPIECGKTYIKIVLVSLFFVIVVMFINVKNTTYVTEEKIICSTLTKKTEYFYNEVSKCEAKFNRDGKFVYTVYVYDERFYFIDAFSNPAIEKYEDDDYLALKEFDSCLLESGAEKSSNEDYIDRCDLADEYIDKILEIIRQ